MSRLWIMGFALVLVAGVAGAQNFFDNGTFEAGEVNEASWAAACWDNRDVSAGAGRPSDVTREFQATDQAHGGSQSMKWIIPGGQQSLWTGAAYPGEAGVGFTEEFGTGAGSYILNSWAYHQGSDTATYGLGPVGGLVTGLTVGGSWIGHNGGIISEGAWSPKGAIIAYSGTGRLQLRLENYGSQEDLTDADKYIVWIDDITMEPAPLSTLINGDFETGQLGWPNTPYGTNEVNSVNPRSGSAGMVFINPQDTSESSWAVSTQQVSLDPADVGADCQGTAWMWVENFAGATYGGSPANIGWRYRVYNDAYSSDPTNPWRWVQPATQNAGDMPEGQWVEFNQWCTHIEEDPKDGNQGDGIFGWELFEYGCHIGSGGDVVTYVDDCEILQIGHDIAVSDWTLY